MNWISEQNTKLNTGKSIVSPKFLNIFVICSAVIIIVFSVSIFFIPWWQTTAGYGRVVALDPNSKIQNIEAMVDGIISNWYVKDGDFVKKGDPIVDIYDNDPLLIQRLQQETDAKKNKVYLSKIAAETSNNNFQRQKKLLAQGLSSEKEFEKAKINYKKLLSNLAQDKANLAKSQIKLSRQQTRTIKAPIDATILQVISGSGTLNVKLGDKIARILPQNARLAVEIFVPGNDFPLLKKDQTSRIQFEGWPAIQTSGWPNLAVGTFAAKVWATDSSNEKNGKFRVLLIPNNQEDWPQQSFLRQGTRAYAWVTLGKVSAAYEIWRRFNGFPLAVDNKSSIFTFKKKKVIK